MEIAQFLPHDRRHFATARGCASAGLGGADAGKNHSHRKAGIQRRLAGEELDIHLRGGAHAEDRGALAQIAAEPESLVVYETAPGDLRAIRAFQSESQSAKEAGRHGQGHIELNGSLACRLSNIPEGPILVDAYIHASDEIGWLPLIAAYDLKAGMRPEDISDARVPSCATQATRAAR